jgi:UrcA family protein
MKCLVVVFSAVALLSSTAALAGDMQVTHQKSVNYGDLNLNSQDGIAALHNRIVAAAAEVCTADANKASEQNRDYSKCQDTAAQKAFADVGRNVSSRLASNQ